MKTLNKLLMATAMIVTLGATASCGNKEKKSGTFVGGLPYTLLEFNKIKTGERCEVKFECAGNPEVYWNSDTPTTETTHVFEPQQRTEHPIVLIKGKVESLWFCDSNGELLADGNSKISGIIFSNTIKKLPKYACYSLQLQGVYLPASIKTIGKNVFFPYSDLKAFVCEPPSRPSGWDVNWCTIGEYSRYMSWGFSYYVTDDYDLYVIINDDPIRSACYEGSLKSDITNLVIPKTINVNNFICSVVSINDVGNSRDVLESVTIPSSVVAIGKKAFSECEHLTEVKFAKKHKYLWIGDHAFRYCSSLENITFPEVLTNFSIGDGAFWDCIKLKSVTFAQEYAYLWFDMSIFDSCSSLKNIVLPKGLVNLSSEMFTSCTNLTSVVVPNTVQTVSPYLFWYVKGDESEGKLTIDLTSYTDANQIPTSQYLLDRCEATTVTFKTNGVLKESDFTEKGWPKSTTTGTPNVVWEDGSTLNA